MKRPFNSSKSFLLGLGFGGVTERALGSFGIEELILFEEEQEEESRDETCKEAIGFQKLDLCIVVCVFVSVFFCCGFDLMEEGVCGL